MHLSPDDLGTKWHILTVRNRVLGVASAWTKPVEPKLGELGKRWIKDLPISEEVAASTLPLSSKTTMGYTYGLGLTIGSIFPGLAVIAATAPTFLGVVGGEVLTLAGAAAVAYTAAVALPRAHLRRLHSRPLTEEELTPFLTGNVPGLPHVFGHMAGKLMRFLQRQVGEEPVDQDGLERSFLLVVRDVIRSRSLPKESEEDLRVAIQSIGEALCRLPPVGEIEGVGSSIRAADQREEARMLYARAELERDPVVSASLTRQADAMESAAQASENGVTVGRRVRALRQELRTQIEVLRLSIPTWGSASSHVEQGAARSDRSVSTVAESLKNVAREAAAVSAARDELDSFVSSAPSATPRRYSDNSDSEQQTIRLR